MSPAMARTAVFLEQMGVGVQWTLRNRPLAEVSPVDQPLDSAALTEPLAEAPPVLSSASVADLVAEVEVTFADVEVQAAAANLAAAAEDDAPAAVPVLAPSSAPVLAPVLASAEESTAWFDEAPAPQRPAAVSAEAIAAMDMPALQAAVSSCTRCNLCDTRRHAVNGRGASKAAWIVLAAAPSRLDEKEGVAMAGEAGLLLDNMLKAIALKPESDVYLSYLVKCRPAGADGAERAPTSEQLQACRPYLERELALTGATMAMTLGQHAAKGLMMGAAARGSVMRYGAAGLPVVATYHPDDLLRRPEDKAKAWADLCLARSAHD